MKEYVVGFYFAESSENVLLIKKATPEWQNGLLNGIGGHVESGEDMFTAMTREFLEETAHLVNTWRYAITLRSPQMPAATKGTSPFALHAFSTRGKIFRPVSNHEGVVGWYRLWRDVPFGPFDVVWNLKWLIPLCYELLWQPEWFLRNEWLHPVSIDSEHAQKQYG